MKHKLTLLLCTVLVIGLAYTAVHEHRDYITKLNQQISASIAKAKAAAAAREAAKQQAVQVAANKKCTGAKASYAALTPYQKLHTKAPDCVVSR